MTPAKPHGLSIRVILPDGSRRSLRVVEQSDWTGAGVVSSRSVLADRRSRRDRVRAVLPSAVEAGMGVLVGVGIFSLSYFLLNHSPAGAFFAGLSASALYATVTYTGDQWQHAARKIGLAGPLAAFFIAGFLARNVHGTGPFFEVSSQVIVILILAVALQADVLNLRRRQGLSTYWVLYLIALLAWGEYSALRGLLDANGADASGTIAAIASGLVGVLMAALARPEPKENAGSAAQIE